MVKNEINMSLNRLVILLIILIPYIQVEGQSIENVGEYFIKKENLINIEFYIGNFGQDTVKVKFDKTEQVETDYFNSPKIFIGNTQLQGEFEYNDIILDSLSTRIISTKSMRYVLLRQKGFVDVDNFLVFGIKNNNLICIEKTVYSKITDVDNDDKFEIGGFHLSEAPCRECDSIYYNPAEMFELGESFSFDRIASKLVTKRFYGIFLGYQPIDTVFFHKFH